MSRFSPSRDGPRPLGTAGSKNSGRAGHASGLSRRRHQATAEPAMTEDDYLSRQPSTGYLEHKRLEVAALHLQSSSLDTCVVGAGVPYGLGEGALLLRVFREAWRARGLPVVLPTCTAGDNRLALIHVADLSIAVGNLLRPVEPNGLPCPFPKPYILAVEGNGAQCTAKEMVEAIGRGFGGSGETQPMGEAELEEVLVENLEALSLLINIRFSNEGGVLSGMVADGTMNPVTWSTGFTGSAKLLAEEFLASRSLQPIKAVVLGPPGGRQDHVCQEAEPSPEAQAALEALPPKERLLADVQAAFEAADMPMSEYTALDAGGLARVLSPSIIARAARLVLEEKRLQWTCSGYILCDIPSHGDVAPDIFADQALGPSPPRPSPTIPAGDSRAGVGGTPGSPKSRGGGVEGRAGSDSPLAAMVPTSDAQPEEVVGGFRPTHVVYLAASLEYIVAQQGREVGAGTATDTGGGKEAEAKLRGDIERFFAQEQQAEQPQTTGGGTMPIGTASSPGGQKRTGDNGSSNAIDNAGGGTAETAADENGYRDTGEEQGWIPATARALQHRFLIKAQAVDVEAVETDGDVSGVVDAVHDHLCGAETPGFVWMLRGDSVDVYVEEGEHADRNMTHKKQADGGEAGANGEEEANAADGGIDTDTTRSAEPAAARNDSNPEWSDDLNLSEVLAKLTARDAKEVEMRTRRHRNFLTEGVVPQVAAGLVAAAEAQPENVFEFLANYLIRAGQALQRKAEEEAASKYQAGLALLEELEANDNKRTAAVYR
ncbi:conserved unknown protein [Ectocarpus siliculosus]|uniref:Uncharacterized protein n=1 Tax=Ectocarpus siliculosus TaxID=2880 RepID=D7FXW4_ECTSI|nr:conserved unknown protein [Ectocarpus siliculosus]|eukprot:CBJ32377.1 conserved unknown protein [Ectocarpus siliculosus]